MNNSKRLISNYSRPIVTAYYLLALVRRESGLLFLRTPVVNGMIKALYYISLLSLYLYSFRGGKVILRKEVSIYTKKFMPLLALYLICEFVAIIFNPEYGLLYGSDSVTHFISIFIKYSIMIPTIFLMYDLRRDKVLETIADALIINQVIVLVSNLFEYGIARTIKDMFSLITSFLVTSESVFEIDGPTYCCGLILIFFVFNKTNKLPKRKYIFLVYALFIGRKRIAIFAFAVAILVKFVLRNIQFDKKRILQFSIVFSIVPLLFIGIL